MKKRTKIFLSILFVALLITVSAIFSAAADSVTVSFYDGDEIVGSVSVAAGEIPTPPDVEEITVTDGVGYRFLGWTDTQDGTEIKDITAAEEDISYYAVREAVAYKVSSADSETVWFAPGTLFSTVMESVSDGDVVTACSDADIDSAVYLGKSVTIDLFGNTLTTTGYIIPDESAYIVIQNGTVEITNRELAQLYEGRSENATLELKNLTVKKTSSSVNKYLLDLRVGSVIMDGVAVNSGEWVIPSSPQAFITVGYKTKSESQKISVTVKNSDITLPNTPFISACGATGETNGYALDIDITDSYVSTAGYVINFQPVNTALDNCSLDVAIDGESTILKSSGFTNQVMFNVNANMPDDKVVIWADYGVLFSKLPRLAAGTLLLGDGDGILDYDTETTYGVVADLWVDDYTPVTDYAYSFCVVGDTQMTNDYDPSNFGILYDWIIANKEAKNLQYVFGMGDITNHSADDEWETAYTNITKLDGIVDYALIRGNHDTTDGFNATFNNEAYKSQFDGFYSEDLIENSYDLFTVGDTEYLHLTLDWQASDAVLSWAGGVIESYPERKVIVSTHAYLSAEGELLTQGSSSYGTTNSGEQMWNKLISQYENVFLVLSGHVFTTDLVCLQQEGVHGNTITALVTNGQCLDYRNGAMGLVSMLYFSEDGKTIDVEYYSTVYDRYLGVSNQFTLTVPEYTEDGTQESDYLYSVTKIDGTTAYYDSTYNLSDILTTYVDNGSLVSVYGDVDVNSGFAVTKYVSLNLNGHTVTTDGGKINLRNAVMNVTNGNIQITNNNFIYIGEGYPKSVANISNVTVSHTTTKTSVTFADTRGGTLNLDNITVTGESWNNLSASFITAGYRTKSTAQAITVNVKNSNINLGTGTPNFIGYTAASGESYGWTATLAITNSDITVGGYVLRANPVSTSAENCAINFSCDGRSTLVSPNIFNVADTILAENVSVSFAAGSAFSSIPAIEGVDIVYADSEGVVGYDDERGMYVVTSMANCGCMLVDENGEVYMYYGSLEFTKELVETAQNANCTIVLLKDMTVPAGSSSSSRYAITASNLTVDLNGQTLIMSAFSYFGSSKTTQLTIKNGTIDHYYTVFYSYSGSDSVTSFTAENVKFIGRKTYAAFDHRIGTLTLTDCVFEFDNSTSSTTDVFTLGYVNNSTVKVNVNLTRCTIDASNSAKRTIFKLYGGRPATVNATDCSFTLGDEGYVVRATASYSTSAADSITLSGCTVSKSNNESSIFTVEYDDISIMLSELYVPTDTPYDTENGTVSLAKGQTKAIVEGGGYMITAPKISIEANLTLYTDFTLNLWLPTSETATKVTVGDCVYLLSDATVIDGKYCVSISSIGVSSAADGMEIYFTYTDGDKILTVSQSYSVVKYASAILSSDEYSAEAKSLMVYALEYIESAYTYSGIELPTALSELIGGDAFSAAASADSSDGVTAVPESETDIGTAGGAISGSKLSLGNSTHFILELNSAYTGTLTLTYLGNDHTYDITNGSYLGNDYIAIDMRAYEFNTEVIYVSAGEYSGSYDLAAYANYMADNGDDALNELLLNLYNYCKEANEYKAYVAAGDGELN